MLDNGDEKQDLRDSIKKLRELLNQHGLPHLTIDNPNDPEMDYITPLEMLGSTFELLINTTLLKYAQSEDDGNYATFMTYIHMQIDSIAMVTNEYSMRAMGLDPKEEFEKAFGKKEQDLPDIIKEGLEGLDLNLN